MLNNHSSTSSSVISAYWPIHGNVITVFEQGQISIGSAMVYFNQMVTISDNTNYSQVIHYTMACIQWMDNHYQSLPYRVSAVVCTNFFKKSHYIYLFQF